MGVVDELGSGGPRDSGRAVAAAFSVLQLPELVSDAATRGGLVGVFVPARDVQRAVAAGVDHAGDVGSGADGGGATSAKCLVLLGGCHPLEQRPWSVARSAVLPLLPGDRFHRAVALRVPEEALWAVVEASGKLDAPAA